MPQPQITWNAAGVQLEHTIHDSSSFLLISQIQHIYLHVYIYHVYWSRQIYTRSLVATKWREPTLHINNHVSSIHPHNTKVWSD